MPGYGCATLWDRVGDQLVTGLLTPFPPVRVLPRLALNLRRAGGLDLVKTLLTPVASLGNQLFGGDHPRLLLSGNAGHADIPLDAPGSGLMGTLMSMLGQTVGFPVPAGGAGQLAAALADRFASLGGEIRVSSAVDQVLVEHGRAIGVRTADGQVLRARHAVVADVVASRLYGGLVRPEDLPAAAAAVDAALRAGPVDGQGRLGARRYPCRGRRRRRTRPGRCTSPTRPSRSPTRSRRSRRDTCPPTRSCWWARCRRPTPPARRSGTESLWAYTHVPQQSVDDAGDEGNGPRASGTTPTASGSPTACSTGSSAWRPASESRILARRVLGPRQLEELDANLVGGAINGGTSQLHQQLVFRPVPGWGRAETPVHGLYLGSASAHPGGGVHGAPGNNAARAAIAHRRLAPRPPLTVRRRARRTASSDARSSPMMRREDARHLGLGDARGESPISRLAQSLEEAHRSTVRSRSCRPLTTGPSMARASAAS